MIIVAYLQAKLPEEPSTTLSVSGDVLTKDSEEFDGTSLLEGDFASDLESNVLSMIRNSLGEIEVNVVAKVSVEDRQRHVGTNPVTISVSDGSVTLIQE